MLELEVPLEPKRLARALLTLLAPTGAGPPARKRRSPARR
jgi:hypothetical protein